MSGGLLFYRTQCMLYANFVNVTYPVHKDLYLDFTSAHVQPKRHMQQSSWTKMLHLNQLQTNENNV